MESSVNSRFVDAAFSAAGAEALCYTHGDMKALIQKHFLSLLRDFPSLSPSVDPFTHHRDGTTPFAAPTVYVFPAAPSARLLPDHPFVDRSTGLTTSPYADTWRYPLSNLSGLARDLTAILTLCPPCGSANLEAERDREEEVTGPLVTRLCRDAARLRAKAEEDIERLWAEQAVLRGRARAVDAAREELEEEREGLERALARKVRDTRVLSEWLGSVCGGANELSDGEGFEEGDETSRRLVANAAAELAIDETVDALTVALEKGLVGVKVYLKQVRALAREQFFHRRMVIQKWSI
ncbi:Protein ELC-like [Ananas comosus]|uniref:Protein ELC-like n=1 Tax=Ananas comosus TaxID=4615 RepID=A0A199VW51_ANACO|nr:Protein ELC-like [Ananas comosus]